MACLPVSGRLAYRYSNLCSHMRPTEFSLHMYLCVLVSPLLRRRDDNSCRNGRPVLPVQWRFQQLVWAGRRESSFVRVPYVARCWWSLPPWIPSQIWTRWRTLDHAILTWACVFSACACISLNSNLCALLWGLKSFARYVFPASACVCEHSWLIKSFVLNIGRCVARLTRWWRLYVRGLAKQGPGSCTEVLGVLLKVVLPDQERLPMGISVCHDCFCLVGCVEFGWWFSKSPWWAMNKGLMLIFIRKEEPARF